MKPKSSLRSFLAVAGSALLAINSAQATQFWDGTGIDANWNTAANWGGDVLPLFTDGNTTATVTINFGGTNTGGTAAGTISAAQTTTNNDLTAGSIVEAISFTNNGTAGRTQAFILQGNSITLGNGRTNEGIQSASFSSGGPIENVIKLDISLGTSGGTQNRLFRAGLNNNIKVEGVISGSSNFILLQDGTGILRLTNANNTYLGPTNIANGGVLEISSIANGGSNSSIGASTNAAGNLLFNSGFNSTLQTTLRYVGSANAATNRAFTIYGNPGLVTPTNSAIESSGLGTLSFTNTAAVVYTNPGVNRNFYLGGTNTGDNSFSLALANNGVGITTFTKQGAGKWIVNGANTYTGATTISDGTLQFAKQVSLYNNNTAGTGWTAANIKVASAATLALNVGGTGEFTTGNVTTLLTNLGGLGGSVAANEGLQASSRISFDTTNATGTFTVADAIANSTGAGGGTIGLTKLGTGTLALSNTSTYTGATTVSAGTLYVTGSLSNSAVTVGANGAIGSNGTAGTLGNGLTINAGGNLDLAGATNLGLTTSGILSLTGNLTLDNLTFNDLVGWNWFTATPGTYKLIDGSFVINWGSTAHDIGSAIDLGNGNKGYFQSGSLNAVIVAVPEPGAALIGGLGLLALLRRRRS